MAIKFFSRRAFNTGVAGFAAKSEAFGLDFLSDADVDGAQKFVTAWDTAWAHHDAKALGSLHSEKAMTIKQGSKRLGTPASFLVCYHRLDQLRPSYSSESRASIKNLFLPPATL